jgi:hypothetical protein
MKQVLFISGVLFFGNAVEAATTATAISVKEARESQVGKIEGEPETLLGGNAGLTISVLLTGEEAGKASQVGKITYTKAVDDTGVSLVIPREENGDPPPFENIDRRFMFSQDPPPADKVLVTLSLAPSARAARKITLIEGKIALRSIETADVVVPITANASARNKALEAAGARVKFEKVDADNNSVDLDITDPKDSVVGFDLIDKEGAKITTSMSSSQSDEKKTVTLGADKIDKDTRLKLTLATKRTDSETPFKLENVPLP